MPFKTKEEKAAYDVVYRVNTKAKRQASNLTWKQKNASRVLWNSCKNRAARNGVEFSITEDDIVIPEFCPVLGYRLEIGGDKTNSPSVDRINSNLGYIHGNIIVVSHRANRIKADATWQELLAISNWLKEQTMLKDSF